MPNGNKSGKIPVISAIIGALCIILYIGALSYGALSIYNSVTERRALGDREFDNLANLASTAGLQSFMDERFIQTIQDAIDGSETILGVIISGSRGEFAFERERGTVISWVNSSPRFVPRFAVTRPPHHLPLRIEGQRNVNIQAVSGYLDYDFCIEILKRVLLIVLFSLTLAFFTLLMDALLAKNTAKSAEIPAANSPPPSPGPLRDSGGFTAKTSGQTSGQNPGQPSGGAEGKKVPEIKKESPLPADKIKPEEAEEAPRDPPQGEDPDEKKLWDDMEDFDFEDEDDFPDFEDEEISEPVKTVKPPASKVPGPGTAVSRAPAPQVPAPETSPDEGGNPADEPQGLFSPRGNVGWESYTEDRLESELHRSASIEQDLILIAMAFKEPERLTKEQFRRFAEEAVLYFEHRDLIFEYGERGLWVIRPNYSLEQGLAAAEEFNSRILSKLPRPVDTRVDLRFGISSRSGRLINAERIMVEAEEALKRASEDPVSHSVAFKSDPEKYRQYISGRNPQSA
jgi:hypothetical protein